MIHGSDGMPGKLVYILASPRSGTTALEYILSSHPRCHAIGEMYHLEAYVRKDPHLILSKGRCTCGQPIKDCSFWKDILDRVTSKLGIEQEQIRTQVPSLSRSINQDERRVLQLHLRLLAEEIAHKTEATIIDSSKSGAYLQTLIGALPGWEIKVIYMLRDPIEVARSQNHWRAVQSRCSLPESYLVLKWWSTNFSNKRVLSQLPASCVFGLTYERFICDCAKVLKDLGGFLDLEDCFSTEVYLRQLHTVAGTPRRFDSEVFVLDLQPRKNATRGRSFLARSLSKLALWAVMTPAMRRSE